MDGQAFAFFCELERITLQVVSSDAFTFYEAKKLCASHSASLISVPDLTTNYAIVCKCPCA